MLLPNKLLRQLSNYKSRQGNSTCELKLVCTCTCMSLQLRDCVFQDFPSTHKEDRYTLWQPLTIFSVSFTPQCTSSPRAPWSNWRNNWRAASWSRYINGVSQWRMKYVCGLSCMERKLGVQWDTIQLSEKVLKLCDKQWASGWGCGV